MDAAKRARNSGSPNTDRDPARNIFCGTRKRDRYRAIAFLERSVFTDILADLCTSWSASSRVASRISGILETDDDIELVKLSVDPMDYDDAVDFHRDYQLVNFLRKCPLLQLGLDRKQEALRKFWEAENQCLMTNLRIRTTGSNGPWDHVIKRAQNTVRRILGSYSLSKIEPFVSFSNGASTRLKKREGDKVFKLQGTMHCGSRCASMASVFINACPSWEKLVRDEAVANGRCEEGSSLWRAFKLVDTCRITTVPKNAKQDRCIAIEPELSMFLQKGFGGYIRDRLKAYGINLQDQTRNQRLACEGSLTGQLATIDLSAASDTVSNEVVQLICPVDWYKAMNSCRSHRVRFDSEHSPDGRELEYSLEKFSSMGNGNTFELESMIFYALVLGYYGKELGAPDVSVYGDDIICPSIGTDGLKDCLEWFGFTLNQDKSFVSGPFRESCGKHYFQGRDVTPHYIDDKSTLEVHQLYVLHNGLTRVASRMGVEGLFRCETMKSTVLRIRSWLTGDDARRFVPDGIGDGGLLVDFDEAAPTGSFKRCRFGGWDLKVLIQRTESVAFPDAGRLVHSLMTFVSGRMETCRLPDGSIKISLPSGVIPKVSREGRETMLNPAGESSFLGKLAVVADWAPTKVRSEGSRFKVAKPRVDQWSYLGPWA